MNDLAWLIVAAVPLLVLWLRAIVETLQRDDLTWSHRLLWLAALVLLPVIGVAIYVVFRPPPRPATTQGDGSGTPAELLVTAAERHQQGKLDDEGYRAELARLDRELATAKVAPQRSG